MTSAADFVAWVGTERATMGFKAEEYRTGALDRWFSVAGSVGNEKLKKAYRHFLTDRYWRSQGCPWGGFVVRWKEMLDEAAEPTIQSPNRSGWSKERLQKLYNELSAVKDDVERSERLLKQEFCTCAEVQAKRAKLPPGCFAGCGFCLVKKRGAENCLAELDGLRAQLLGLELEFAKLARRRAA